MYAYKLWNFSFKLSLSGIFLACLCFVCFSFTSLSKFCCCLRLDNCSPSPEIGHIVAFEVYPLQQGSPNPGLWTYPWHIRNQATRQEVSGGQVSEASFAAPHCSLSLTLLPEPLLALPPEPWPPITQALPPEQSSLPIRGKIVFHKTGPWCQKAWGPLLYSNLGSLFKSSSL